MFFFFTRKSVSVQVEPLVVRQEDLVNVKDKLVHQDTLRDLDGVEGVVLQRVSGVGGNRLVVLHGFPQAGMAIFRNKLQRNKKS